MFNPILRELYITNRAAFDRECTRLLAELNAEAGA